MEPTSDYGLAQKSPLPSFDGKRAAHKSDDLRREAAELKDTARRFPQKAATWYVEQSDFRTKVFNRDQAKDLFSVYAVFTYAPQRHETNTRAP
jgi:hypothetical protein